MGYVYTAKNATGLVLVYIMLQIELFNRFFGPKTLWYGLVTLFDPNTRTKDCTEWILRHAVF